MATMIQHDEPNEYQKAAMGRTVNLMVDVSDTALRRVRAGFNPDNLTEVGHLHLLAAAFITACERLRDREKPMLPQNGLPEDVPAHGFCFGEDQGRYLVTLAKPKAESLVSAARAAGVPAGILGETGGNALTLAGGNTISLSKLRAAHEGFLPALMNG